MNEQFDLVRLPFPPAWVQRTGLALGAPLGRLLGYEPVYAPAEVPEQLDEAASKDATTYTTRRRGRPTRMPHGSPSRREGRKVDDDLHSQALGRTHTLVDTITSEGSASLPCGASHDSARRIAMNSERRCP